MTIGSLASIICVRANARDVQSPSRGGTVKYDHPKRVRKARSPMTYRIFRKVGAIPLWDLCRPGQQDVTVKGDYRAAALDWASKYALPSAIELDLMVCRFGSNCIAQMRHVKLRRQSAPWVVVPFQEFDDDEPEEFD